MKTSLATPRAARAICAVCKASCAMALAAPFSTFRLVPLLPRLLAALLYLVCPALQTRGLLHRLC
eukprot:1061109-Lingulodinium_polyedra.AAC.1